MLTLRPASQASVAAEQAQLEALLEARLREIALLSPTGEPAAARARGLALVTSNGALLAEMRALMQAARRCDRARPPPCIHAPSRPHFPRV